MSTGEDEKTYDLPMPLEVGCVFAGYTILQVLGSGAMGAVYLATHPRLPRQDALKVLPADLTADPQYRAWFLREAEVAAGLSHPHVVRIHDRGEFEGQFWISMDYVDGTDAARLLREYPNGMPVDEALTIVRAVGSALDYAHHRGLLHRDVKPANILLAQADGQPERVFLADFGIAKPIDDPAGLTATNAAVGTVAYAAPEQLKGEPVDGRADQYALACTAFHLLSGAPPYDHPNSTVVISHHVTSPPPSIGARRAELAGLDPVFAKAMAKDAADRFGSCGEFAEQLTQRLTMPYPDTPPPVYAAYAQDIQATDPSLTPTVSELTRSVKPPLRKRHPRLLIGALVAVPLLVAGGVFGAVELTRHSQSVGPAPTASAAATATAAANTGPFTGTYRADFGKIGNMEGQPPAGVSPTTETWSVRSVCRETNCVATGSRVNGSSMQLNSVVFDKVGDGWVAVTLGTSTCGQAQGEIWETFRLQTRPDGTLSGDATEVMGDGCANKRTVTFTRTGDADINSLPDPASLAARVVSPAEALHGSYLKVDTEANGYVYEHDYVVRTDCLRTGDRCMSLFHSPPAIALSVEFADGHWTYNHEMNSTCSTGGKVQVKVSINYPLPQPAQDPITLLSGQGRAQVVGGSARCPSTNLDEKFKRTGD